LYSLHIEYQLRQVILRTLEEKREREERETEREKKKQDEMRMRYAQVL
jgi:hypothetical protein